MTRPKICASIVNMDYQAIKRVESAVDLYEVRIDLIGADWRDVARRLIKPWIACNRKPDEGGVWRGNEKARVAELLSALELGVAMVDIELSTDNLGEVVKQIKGQAKCLISYHDTKKTPSVDLMKELVQRQLAAGADIGKVVTTAEKFRDNISTLQLIQEFPESSIVSFAMGQLGLVSRVLCPLVGGEFIYAAIASGREAAPGQITAEAMRQIYKMVQR
jgi:3-dehydroquinate dehydratase-1